MFALRLSGYNGRDSAQSANVERVRVANTPAISIIIPVYNVGRQLRRAVESLLAQTFDDYEIFLVDDGSTDSSGALCDELAQQDARVKVIHRENGGAAAARNTAIAKAAGEYLYFMDGDDWCEPTMLFDLHRFTSENKLDLAVVGFFIDTYYAEDKFFQELRTAPDAVYESQQDFRNHAHELFDAQLLYAPWNKLYRRKYLAEKDIVFPATFWDDLPFNLAVIRDVQRVGCMNRRYYHFLRARAESENTRYRADMYGKREEEHAWMQELYAYWGIDTPEIREFLARRYAERLLGCVENVTNKNCTLSAAEKRGEIARMLHTPQAREALASARPRTAMMRVALAPLRSGNVRMTMLEGSLISWVKRNNTNAFARLKANR